MTQFGNNNWEIIKPVEITNEILNPSIEVDTTGYSASGAALIRSSASQFYGAYSLEVTPTSGASNGVYYGNVTLTSGCTYTFSAYIKGQVGIPYRIYFATTGAASLGGGTAFTATGGWERQEVSYTETSTASRRAYITKNESANTGAFYIDGLQVENRAAATTYCDGDQPGCFWLADEHAYKSRRDGQSREGGEIINLNDDYDIIVRQQPGAGMPPVENIQTELGLSDGGLFQRTRTDVRSFVLEGVVSGSDTTDFHFNRQRLIDTIKPDLVSPQQPFLLRYTGASGITKQIKCHYDGGLELTQPTNNIELFSMRLISYEPYWEELQDRVVVPGVRQSFAAGVYLRDRGGTWGAIIGASFTEEAAGVMGSDNKLYIAGASFGGAGVYKLARVNLDTFTSEVLHSGSIDGAINSMDFDSLGDLYLGGLFTLAGSVSASRVAKWDGNDFSAVGDGLDDEVNVVKVDRKTDTLYVGGDFTTSGSISASRIASFDGNEFQQVGDGADNVVTAIEFENSGSRFYIGGDFTSSGSISPAPSRFALFNGTEFESVGSASLNNTVQSIQVLPNDTAYIGGLFTGTFSDAAGSPQYLAYWNGVDYSIGADDSLDNTVTAMFYDMSTGLLHVIGTFSQAGDLTSAKRYAVWTGTAWYYAESAMETSGAFIITTPNREIAIGGISNVSSGAFGVKTDITSLGTSFTSPWKVEWTASASNERMFFLKNLTANKEIHHDYTLLDNETVLLSPLDVTAISKYRGNVIGDILPGSNFADWGLWPGGNSLMAFTSSSNVVATIIWRNRHWSLDGT
jgi:hypothetical protein